MIKLCYVEGINEVDTPWFDTKDEQSAFFDNLVRWSDEDSYYPPYFMNTIRLSSDDISFNSSRTKVNYCILDYEDKRYYYFIDSINYVTDELVEITIEMDTIQTYLFDMKVINAVISRMPINRWGDDGIHINRDYVRENISSGNMVKRFKKELPVSDLKWIVVRTSDRIEVGDFYYDPNNHNADVKKYLQSVNTGEVRYVSVDESKHSSYVTNGGYFYLVPYGNWVSKSESLFLKFGDTYRLLTQIDSKLAKLSSDSRVLSMSLIPFNPFPDITLLKTKYTQGYITGDVIEIQSRSVTINAYVADDDKFEDITLPWFYFGSGTNEQGTFDNNDYFLSILFPSDKETETSFFKDTPYLKIKPIETMETFKDYVSSSKVTTATTLWNPSNVPALLDENYIQLHIGDNSGTTIAPLFYATTPSIRCSEWTTLDGGMAYSFDFDSTIENDYGGVIKDMANTALMNDNAITFDLYTDPWKNYQVTHKGSIVTDWVSSGANAVSKAAGAVSLIEATHSRMAYYNRKKESRWNFSGINGVGDYVTGFSNYRKHVYYGERTRDPKTGRFVSPTYWTYTGGV